MINMYNLLVTIIGGLGLLLVAEAFVIILVILNFELNER